MTQRLPPHKTSSPRACYSPPSWELPLQQEHWVWLQSFAERQHPAASCGSHVSAEVCSPSSQTQEEQEEQRVRQTLHLQASPHTYLLGKVSDPWKLTWKRCTWRGKSWPPHPQLLEFTNSPVQKYNTSHQDTGWYQIHILIIHVEKHWNGPTHYLFCLTGKCNSGFQLILWAALAKPMVTKCLSPQILHLKAPQPQPQHWPPQQSSLQHPRDPLILPVLHTRVSSCCHCCWTLLMEILAQAQGLEKTALIQG